MFEPSIDSEALDFRVASESSAPHRTRRQPSPRSHRPANPEYADPRERQINAGSRHGDRAHTTPRATRTRLIKLVEHGLLREIGSGPQDPKRRYFRVGAA